MMELSSRKAYISRQESRDLEKDIFFAVISSLVTLGIGTVGYQIVEGWSALDSLYMSIITVTTVGFMEVQPLTDEGKLFTTLYIAIGVLNVGYLFSVLGRAILHGELGHIRYWRRMEKKLDSLNGHIIVCGFGRLSRATCQKLAESFELIVIEKSAKGASLARSTGYFVVEGDATDDEVLQHAGISKASKLLALLPSDADNVFITLSAKETNPELVVKARAESHDSMRRLKRAGADSVICPYEVAADEIQRAIN